MTVTRQPQVARQETILLVENDPAVRQLFAEALARAGYTVHEARTGQEALGVFDQYGDAIDLLVTDVHMPVMNGLALAGRLQARRASLKVIYVSGYPLEVQHVVAADYLAKPFKRDEFLSKVREVLDR